MAGLKGGAPSGKWDTQDAQTGTDQVPTATSRPRTRLFDSRPALVPGVATAAEARLPGHPASITRARSRAIDSRASATTAVASGMGCPAWHRAIAAYLLWTGRPLIGRVRRVPARLWERRRSHTS